MAFTVPSREDLATEHTTQYAGQFPEKNVSRGSDPWRLGRVISAVAWSIVAKLLFFDKMRLPDTARGEYLTRWGGIYKFPKLEAAPAVGPSALLATGTPGIAVAGFLTHADGTVYEVTTPGAVIGGGGSVTVSIKADTPGSATNKNAGEILTFSSPPLGLNAQATLVANLVDGTDFESDDHYQPRLGDRIADPPQGGAIADYYQNALAVAGVDTAYVYEHRGGLGTIHVAVLANQRVSGPLAQVGPSRVIADLTPVSAAVSAKRPGAMADFEVITVAPQTQDVVVNIEIDETTYSWDWDDFGVGYVITAFNVGAQTITVPSLPVTATAGKRITVDGEEATIVSVAPGNVLTLSFTPPPAQDGQPPPVTRAWFPNDPTVGITVVRASGDLVWPVRNAIIAEFGRLGPARGDGAAIEYAATAWVDTLKLSRIDAAAVRDAGGGVTDIDIITPVANVVPVDTFGDTVPLLVPGKIQVHKKP
jgi:uncharacterized phage protein gp47/JayE